MRRPVLLLTVLTAAPLVLVLPALPGAAAPAYSLGQVEAQVAALNQQAELASERFDTSQLALQTATRALATARAHISQEQRAVVALEHQLARLAAFAYEDGNLSGFSSFFAAGSTQQLLNSVGDLDQLSRQRSEQLAGLQAADEALGEAVLGARQAEAGDRLAAAALARQRSNVLALLAKERSLLAGLQASQRAVVLTAVGDTTPSAAPAASPAAPGLPADSSRIVRIALSVAYAQIGKPYQWGGAGPDSFDCSGLTMYAFAAAGVMLPHSAAAQYDYGTHVSIADLQPGDLVFYAYDGYIGHVGIYVGNGEMIDAPHTGAYVGIHPLYSGLIGGTRL